MPNELQQATVQSILNKSSHLLTYFEPNQDYFLPFKNASIFHLMKWHHTGSAIKTLAEFDCLVDEVILAKDFKRIDFIGFCVAKEAKWCR